VPDRPPLGGARHRPFGTGWTYDDGVTRKLTEEQMFKIESDCQVQAFGNH
jgi:hypothetical protein